MLFSTPTKSTDALLTFVAAIAFDVLALAPHITALLEERREGPLSGGAGFGYGMLIIIGLVLSFVFCIGGWVKLGLARRDLADKEMRTFAYAKALGAVATVLTVAITVAIFAA